MSAFPNEILLFRSGRRFMSTVPMDIAGLTSLCEDLSRATDIEASLDVLEATMHDLGWARVIYGWKSLDTTREAPLVPIITRGFPDNWDRRWSDHSAYDPYFNAVYDSQKPVVWSDVRASMDVLTPKQIDCLHYVEDLGVMNGLTVPIRVPGRRFAFVTALNFENCEASFPVAVLETQVELIKLIAHFFDNQVLGGSTDVKGIGVCLSRREQECLLWTARGKTVDDIATIVGISAETVRTYISRIISKLNATNKTHAVAKAIHLGLVTID